MTKSFAETYPTIARWIANYGWVEIGKSDYSESLVRAFAAEGLVWENLDKYKTIDDALQALEASLASWLEDHA
ncbi:MAG: hypothetical protein RMK91_00850 [Pseudanabaenaceae cyanobacterium SKYGB_i_bin29]|nr:hypothetical protein [Pseudanabaenaceae cyanobacterium SKYG29]MDW8420400.1 hypothetical protein [Pseudanabaenaceae cyanobacterium SKYGB_i_bin29]